MNPRLLAAAVVLAAALASGRAAVTAEESADTITLRAGTNTVLVYHKAEDPAPAGTDPAFSRSGFIHPLCSPSGEVLTMTRLADHLHHMGLWHAWTDTKHEGRKVDFWNLKDKMGRVRFARTVKAGPVDGGAGFTVVQEHVEYRDGKGGDAQVVLEEEFSVAAREEGGAYVADYNYTQKNVSAAPLELQAYRYGGGVGFRGRADWKTATSDYLTSDGRTRTNSHQTRANWLAVHGETPGGGATVVMMGHPGNHDAPQRIRTWTEKDHGGAIFANFVPTQETAWSLAPGASLTLRYRIVTMNGRADAARIDPFWKAYAR